MRCQRQSRRRQAIIPLTGVCTEAVAVGGRHCTDPWKHGWGWCALCTGVIRLKRRLLLRHVAVVRRPGNFQRLADVADAERLVGIQSFAFP